MRLVSLKTFSAKNLQKSTFCHTIMNQSLNSDLKNHLEELQTSFSSKKIRPTASLFMQLETGTEHAIEDTTTMMTYFIRLYYIRRNLNGKNC